jgi:hypothetical protein
MYAASYGRWERFPNILVAFNNPNQTLPGLFPTWAAMGVAHWLLLSSPMQSCRCRRIHRVERQSLHHDDARTVSRAGWAYVSRRHATSGRRWTAWRGQAWRSGTTRKRSIRSIGKVFRHRFFNLYCEVKTKRFDLHHWVRYPLPKIPL